MPPSLKWVSEEKKRKEWEIANKWLKDQQTGTKLSRSKGWFSKKRYLDNAGNRHTIDHSFIVVEDKILAIAGGGRVLGEGTLVR